MVVGQDPYSPFENDRLQWQTDSSEGGAAVLAERSSDVIALRQPAIVLFLAGQDSANCCAANYERIVFRDRQVLRLAREFAQLRVDRTYVDDQTLARFEVTPQAPALLLLDNEGVVRGRFERCTNAAQVKDLMVLVLRASRAKARVAEDMNEQFERVAELDAGAYRETQKQLRRVLRWREGPERGIARANRMLADLEASAAQDLDVALNLETVADRYRELLHLRHELWNFEQLIPRVRTAVTDLEENEATCEAVRECQAQVALEAALEALETRRSRGRALLIKVQRDFPDTEAARQAAAALE
ncbi:hypothetical protein OAX78_03155 [Planctomycetota bacterium]|nr:hypothetical protein [Planctomycetota bacterium]